MAIPFPEKYLTLLNDNCLINQKSPQVWKLSRKDTTGRVSIRATNLAKYFRTEDKHSGTKNITVLIVGETGNGKSTLINGLINFAVGVTWKEDVWFEVLESVKNQTDSQTAEVTVYELKQNDFSLTLIDTPGLGDTRGMDGLMTERLLKILGSEGGVGQVHAVGLVLKATENRLSDRMAYVLNSVTSLFGKNMRQNIVALITHSDGRKTTKALQALEAAKIQCARNENNELIHFLFDNCLGDDRKEDSKYLKLAYETTTRGMKQFMEFLQQCKPNNLSDTINVLKKRESLKHCIQNLQTQVGDIDKKKNDIQHTQEALRKYHQKIEICRNFKTEEIETYKTKEKVDSIGLIFPSGALCCTKCEENCHYPGCTWAQNPSKCEVIKKGNCTVCPGKCPAADHVKENWKYVEKFRKVKKTNEEMKERYERNQEKLERKNQELADQQKEMSELQQTKNQYLDEAFGIIEELEETALNVNAVSTYVHLDLLIQKMEETGDTEKTHKLETMRDRMDEKNMAGFLDHSQKST